MKTTETERINPRTGKPIDPIKSAIAIKANETMRQEVAVMVALQCSRPVALHLIRFVKALKQ
jgi:hypothetical protein